MYRYVDNNSLDVYSGKKYIMICRKEVMVVLFPPPQRGGNSTTITPFLQIMIYFLPEYILSKSFYMYPYMYAVKKRKKAVKLISLTCFFVIIAFERL